jgi:hypothetical protein
MFLFLGVKNSRAAKEYALSYPSRSVTFKGVNVFRRFMQLFRETESVTSTTIVNSGECTDGSQKVVGAEVPCELRHTVNLIRRFFYNKTKQDQDGILVLLESCLQTYMTYTNAECTVNELPMMDRRTVRNM